EFSAASRQMEEITDTITHSTRAKVMAAILKPLDVEGQFRRDLPSTDESGNTILYPINPEATGVFRMLVFMKHGVTFRELVHKIDVAKDSAAHRKLMSVHRDYWAVLTTKDFEDL